MPEIPQAASYNQIPGGLQLGLGFQAAQLGRAQLAEQQRHAQAEEALGQGTLQIQQAAAQRQAEEYQQASEAQKYGLRRFLEERAKLATTPQTGDLNGAANASSNAGAAFAGPGATEGAPTQESEMQTFQRIIPEMAARYPASTLEKILPVMQRGVITPYQQENLNLREKGLGLQSQKIMDAEELNRVRPLTQMKLEASKGGFDIYPNGVNKDLPNYGLDKDEYDKYLDANKLAKRLKVELPAVRNAQAIVDGNDELQDKTPEEKKRFVEILLANKGAAPTLTAKAESDIKLQDAQLRAARNALKLADLTDKFGPEAFVMDKLGVLSTSLTDPEVTDAVSEYNNLKQSELRMYGARVTGPETKMVIGKIGSPFDVRYKRNLVSEIARLQETLGRSVQGLKNQYIDVLNPKWRGDIRDTWARNVADAEQEIKDHGGKVRYTSPSAEQAQEAAPQAQARGGQLTREKVDEFMRQAGGDKAKARKLAEAAGYTQ